MEEPTTPKRARPLLTRSHTAHASTTPPSKPPTAVSPAAKRAHHLKPLRTHHVYRRHRDDEKGAVQSATLLQAPRLFADAWSPVSKTLSSSQSAGKNATQTVTHHSPEGSALLRAKSRLVRPEEVMEERERGRERNEELRSSLNSLSDVAQATTRKLDNTWYNILEKVSVLQSTIGSFQELSAATKKLHQRFDKGTSDLETEFQDQVDRFGGFDAQQRSIDELEIRVRKGMEQANALSERLESAKRKVELWEKREKVWQAKTTRRLRIFGTCFGLAILLVVLLTYIPLDFSTETHRESPKSPRSIPDFAASILEEAMASKTPRPHHSHHITLENTTDDGRLHILDEL